MYVFCGRINTTLFGDGSEEKEAYWYDDRERIAKAVYSLNDGVIVEGGDKTVEYEYDSAGNRIADRTTVNFEISSDRALTYGTQNRLLSIHDTINGSDSKFEYDVAGNRVKDTGSDGEVLRVFSETGRLEKVDKLNESVWSLMMVTVEGLEFWKTDRDRGM